MLRVTRPTRSNRFLLRERRNSARGTRPSPPHDLQLLRFGRSQRIIVRKACTSERSSVYEIVPLLARGNFLRFYYRQFFEMQIALMQRFARRERTSNGPP